MNHKQLWKGNNLAKNRKSLSKNISLASIDTNELVADARTKPTPNSAKWKKEYQSNEPYTAWVSLFNDFYNVSKEGSVPSFTNEVAGALAAIDYKTKSNNVFGGGLAYAFNYSHYSESLGHAKINEEMAVLFGSFPCDRIFVNATLWGGLFQVNNVRHTHTFTTFTATSHTHGWILNPHVELSSIAYRNDADWFAIEPFITEDWVNYWQSGYKERGASGFNLRMKHHYASLLRSEIGARFYEKLTYDWGRLLIEAKGSYINQAPFHLGSTTTAFVGAVSTFSVALGNNKVQNLAGVDLNLSFFPKDTKYPYGSVVFEGEFGSSLQSYFVALEIGKKF